MELIHPILILDDEEFIIQALGKAIQKLGYEVVLCLHPREALNRLENSQVDLLISDFRMPSMNGLEFFMLAQSKAPKAGRILLVEPKDRELAMKAMSRGMADWYIEKPWREELLKTALSLFLRYQKLSRQFQKLNKTPGMELGARGGTKDC